MKQLEVKKVKQETIVKIESLTGIKNAILKHKKVWLTRENESHVYAELNKDGTVWVNYGLSNDTRTLHDSIMDIGSFLSFK
jgi:hypothetical protein